MLESFVPYQMSIWVMGGMGILLLVQVIVADLAGIRAGHRPGFPIESNYRSFLFRASRSYANTNETLGAFILLILVAMFAGVSSTLVNACALIYGLSRGVHMLAYYANISILRSVAFGVSLLALAVMAGSWLFQIVS